MSQQIKIGGRLHSIAEGNVATGANEILDDSKGKKQSVINQETDAELERLNNAKQDNLTFDTTPTEGSTNPITSGGVFAADAEIQQAIEAILLLIPSAASALNQLADKAFVNSTVATNTATFRGTYNVVTDLELHYDATHQQIATALLSKIQEADNNDYCFVQIPVSDSSGDIRVTERYKFNGTAWSYEYDLNNSGFTAAQWAAINSTITQALVEKLGALPTAAELAIALNGKQNTLTFDTAPVAGSSNPVTSAGLYAAFAAINATIPAGASADNKLVAETRLAEYVAAIINALDATYNVTSTDGHVNVRLTQVDGAITSVEVLTNDIASAAALNTLTGRVSTAESDIDALQDAYAALTQSDVVIVNGALPSSGQQQNIIYRQPDQDHTPPQFYSDYMWNGTTWVLMATYNNAIDPRPKKGSQNLVTSGGVFDNMGALDVSELNATENPHTLATYADLSEALATIPSDYQKGGMSIKFVQTSDNKYVQFRLMSQTFSTTESDWQGVDDEPIAGSENLVKSGGVYPYTKVEKYEFLDFQPGYIDNGTMSIGDVVSTQRQISTTGTKSAVIACNAGDVFTMNNLSPNGTARPWAFVDSEYRLVKRDTTPFETSRYYLIAPVSGYLIANDNSNSVCFKGKDLAYVQNEENEKIEFLKLEQILFEQGGIYTDTGKNAQVTTRLRSAGYISGNYHIDLPDGVVAFGVAYYDASTLAFTNFVLDPAGNAYVNVGESGKVARIVLKKSDNSDITPADVKHNLSLEYLNAESEKIKDSLWFNITEELSFGRIVTNEDIGSVVDFSVVSTSEMKYIIIPCKAGEQFRITGTGTSLSLLWCFTDIVKKVVSKSSQNETGINLVLTASSNGYLICNVNASSAYKFDASIDELERRNVRQDTVDWNNIILEKGGIGTGNGLNMNNDYLVRTVDYIRGKCKLTVPDGYNIRYAFLYNISTRAFVQYVQVLGKSYDCSGEYAVRVTIQKGDTLDTPITPSDIKDILSLEYIYDMAGYGVSVGKKYNHINSDMVPSEKPYGNDVISQVPYNSGTAYTLQEIYDGYDDLVSDYPGYVKKTDLGLDSSGDYHIYKYEFTPESPDIVSLGGGYQNGKKYDENRYPLVVLDSGIHGSEKPCTRALLNLMSLICGSKNDDGVLGWLRRNVRFWVIPVVCPYGYVNETRWNVNHVNLNRNFDTPNWTNGSSDPTSGDYRGSAPASEVETQYVQQMLDDAKDDGYAVLYYSYHTHGDFSSYAAMTSYAFTGDNEVDDLQKLGVELAKAISLSGWKNHNLPLNSGYIGVVEYLSSLALSADYAYRLGILAATPECMYKYYDGQGGTDYSTDLNCMNVEYILKTIIIGINRLLYM